VPDCGEGIREVLKRCIHRIILQPKMDARLEWGIGIYRTIPQPKMVAIL
jgi:hypothetical protein